MNDVRFILMPRLGAVLLISASMACGDAGVSSQRPVLMPAPPVAGAAAVSPTGAASIGPAAPVAHASPVGSGAAGAPASAAPPAAGDTMWCGVKRTLDARCTACHNEQKTAGAPMALKTHADVQAPAVSDPSKKVYQLVGVRVHDTVRPMPPQAKLTAQQLSEIDAWVAAGGPAGSDPTCASNGALVEPTASAWPDNCDATYKVLASTGGRPNTIAAGVETHPQVAVTPPWGNKEVQAIAWRAITDNAKILHHWILYGPSREFLFGWAPGKDINEPLPPDVGVFLPSGGMTLDVHYNNLMGTQMESDASGVEICVLEKAHFRPKTATVTMRLSQSLISVPARATNVDVTGTCTHSGSPVRLLSASPHAHKNANHMTFTVEKANGKKIVMHDDAFNFEEQTVYAMTPPVVIESGDRIITTCRFSNPTDRTITFGENTGNEMCFNFALYEPMGGLTCAGLGFGGL